jgi:cob(I)alamin adenosyltransferase
MIGVALSHIDDKPAMDILFSVQHDLFDIGAELCQPGKNLIDSGYVEALESTAEDLNKPLPPLKEFILPGGSRSVAFLQLTRTICRRAERSLHNLAAGEDLNPFTTQYINRLSDLLFILARHVAFKIDGKEVYWGSRFSRMKKDT